MAYNFLNLPAIHQAAQRTQANKFAMDRAETTAEREDTQYDEEQRLRNTAWLAGATKVILDEFDQNPDGAYAAIEELGRIGIEKGVIDADTWDPWSVTRDKVAELNTQARTGLGGMQVPGQGVQAGKYWINPDTETMWYFDEKLGKAVNTGTPAQQYAARPVQTGEGVIMVSGGSGQPIQQQPGQPVQPGSGSSPYVVPGTDPETVRETKALEAASVEQAKNDVQTADDYRVAEQVANKTWKQYEAARNALMSGLAGTDTGYFMGKIPPVTEGQQVAVGGVAAMAPIMKQLFRAAGEGVFTDKDQQLLMDMIPDRNDLEPARLIKMEAIDRIVRMKLGMDDIEILQQARAAIAKGADEEAVKERLQLKFGIDPRRL